MSGCHGNNECGTHDRICQEMIPSRREFRPFYRRNYYCAAAHKHFFYSILIQCEFVIAICYAANSRFLICIALGVKEGEIKNIFPSTSIKWYRNRRETSSPEISHFCENKQRKGWFLKRIIKEWKRRRTRNFPKWRLRSHSPKSLSAFSPSSWDWKASPTLRLFFH